MKADKVTLVEIKYPRADREKQTSFLLVWQDWLKETDERICISTELCNSPEEEPTILVQGIFRGLPEEALEIISPLIALGGARYRLKYLPFKEALSAFNLS